jgi:hypothetical protein
MCSLFAQEADEVEPMDEEAICKSAVAAAAALFRARRIRGSERGMIAQKFPTKWILTGDSSDVGLVFCAHEDSILCLWRECSCDTRAKERNSSQKPQR